MTHSLRHQHELPPKGKFSRWNTDSALPHAIISFPTAPLCNIPVVHSLQYYTKSGFFYAPVGIQCCIHANKSISILPVIFKRTFMTIKQCQQQPVCRASTVWAKSVNKSLTACSSHSHVCMCLGTGMRLCYHTNLDLWNQILWSLARVNT